MERNLNTERNGAMSVRRVMGTETEYAVSAPGQGRYNSVQLSFDVVGAASDASLRFKQAIETLRQLGVAADVPGFDILTLDSTQSDDLGRLIELKSSGVSARTQTMTWNEWKTAGIATLRARYFLYLVGNLRADLDATPFIRAIRDPFGELVANERKDRTVKRSVQLDVLAFEQAEYQELTVRNSQHEVL